VDEEVAPGNVEVLYVHAQLLGLARELKLRDGDRGHVSYARLHRALLSGLLRNVGTRTD